MTRRFATLDVFTDTRFAGNPLAVVLDAEGLDAETMQTIAREFNLSETVFVFPPADADTRASLRIFTPATELPFAGHPTVGTAVLLAGIDGGGDRRFTLAERIGPVTCRVRSRDATRGEATFSIPRLPAREGDGPAAGAMAAALGVDLSDIATGGMPAERWSAGNPFTFVPLRSLDAMARCRLDLAAFGRVFGEHGRAAVYLFCRETASPQHQFHARMFAPSMGMLEDPATGSAVAAFAGYLAAHGGYGDGDHVARIEQGYEMGRPSLMILTISIAGGRLTDATIAGHAVVVMNGTLEA